MVWTQWTCRRRTSKSMLTILIRETVQNAHNHLIIVQKEKHVKQNHSILAVHLWTLFKLIWTSTIWLISLFTVQAPYNAQTGRRLEAHIRSYTVIQYNLLPFWLFDRFMFMTSSYMSQVTKGSTNFLHREDRRNLWLLKHRSGSATVNTLSCRW